MSWALAKVAASAGDGSKSWGSTDELARTVVPLAHSPPSADAMSPHWSTLTTTLTGVVGHPAPPAALVADDAAVVPLSLDEHAANPTGTASANTAAARTRRRGEVIR